MWQSETAMSLMISTESPPLAKDADGVIRVGGTRVSLDSAVFAFLDGSTPEEIVQQYPAIDLADAYASVAYYLNHRDEVDAYLRERRTQREQIRREVEARFDPQGIRDRLVARRDKK
jgi:uncharacterized protein (DUF433 family)